MSNALNVATTASDIIDALTDAKEIFDANKENSAEARTRGNSATLRGYALAAVAIRTLLDQGLWTTGKQKKGLVSASSALKDALVTEAKANQIAPNKAKRLIEKAAALVVPGNPAHMPEVHVAAAQSADVVVQALKARGVEKEIDILVHVEPRVTDVVARLMKAISKLEDKDRKGFIREIVSHEIIDDILPEAEKTTADEREAARKAAVEAKAKPKASVVKRDAVEKGKGEAKKAKADAAPKEPKAKAEKANAVPKTGGSKKGAMTKAKEADPLADPFVN